VGGIKGGELHAQTAWLASPGGIRYTAPALDKAGAVRPKRAFAAPPSRTAAIRHCQPHDHSGQLSGAIRSTASPAEGGAADGVAYTSLQSCKFKFGQKYTISGRIRTGIRKTADFYLTFNSFQLSSGCIFVRLRADQKQGVPRHNSQRAKCSAYACRNARAGKPARVLQPARLLCGEGGPQRGEPRLNLKGGRVYASCHSAAGARLERQ